MKVSHFEMQVSIREEQSGKFFDVWRSVHPSGTIIPYKFKTKQEAQDSLEMCYPDTLCNQVRVIEVNELRRI